MFRKALWTVCAVVSVCGIGASPPAAAQNLITNGDFETGDFTGWTASSQWYVSPTYGRLSGSYLATGGGDLGNHGPLSQNLSLITGASYALSFDWMSGSNPYTGSVDISIGNLRDNVWGLNANPEHYSGIFTANGNNTLLFDQRSMGAFTAIDNVRVVPLASLTAADIFGGDAIHPYISGSTMVATVTPNYGLTLSQAASILHLKEFNFQQSLTQVDTPLLLKRADGTLAGAGTFDPGSAGLSYSPGNYGYLPGESNSFYFDPNGDAVNLTGQAGVNFNLAGNIFDGGRTLRFSDTPSNPCYSALTYLPYISECGLLPTSGFTYFRTTLVGVNEDGSPTDPLFEFNWKSNFAAFGSSGLGGPVFTNNPMGSGGPPNYQGTGGVQLLSSTLFPQAAAVPEPATWLTLILGFGAIGAAMRGRPKIGVVQSA